MCGGLSCAAALRFPAGGETCRLPCRQGVARVVRAAKRIDDKSRRQSRFHGRAAPRDACGSRSEYLRDFQDGRFQARFRRDIPGRRFFMKQVEQPVLDFLFIVIPMGAYLTGIGKVDGRTAFQEIFIDQCAPGRHPGVIIGVANFAEEVFYGEEGFRS